MATSDHKVKEFIRLVYFNFKRYHILQIYHIPELVYNFVNNDKISFENKKAVFILFHLYYDPYLSVMNGDEA